MSHTNNIKHQIPSTALLGGTRISSSPNAILDLEVHIIIEVTQVGSKFHVNLFSRYDEFGLQTFAFIKRLFLI